MTLLARARALLAPHPSDADPHADEVRLLHASDQALLDGAPVIIEAMIQEIEFLRRVHVGPRSRRQRIPPKRRL